MARVYVKGYTKKDGTKVPGHYREMQSSAGPKAQLAAIKRINSEKLRRSSMKPSLAKASVQKRIIRLEHKYNRMRIASGGTPFLGKSRTSR